jgi:hypothetical protein
MPAHPQRNVLSGFLLALALGAMPVAQDPVPALSAADFRVPVHSADAGVWTAGPAYKASFHDGFVFYPRLGEAYPHNLPLRWTTTSITAGGLPIAMPEATRHEASDWRYAYVRGGVAEVYDMRPEGIEQSFVIAERPAPGELVIQGQIDTELRCAAVGPAHQALVFHDHAGVAIVRYGEAFAIDAVGRRTEVATAYDGGTVSLTVAGGWLAQATFPVVVDPLTSPVVLVSSFAGSAASCDVGHQGESATRDVLFAYDFAFSGSDHDVYAYLCNQDYSNRVLVMSQSSATIDDRNVSVAFVAGADRWLVGFVRGGSTVRVYFHDKSSTTANSGTFADDALAFFTVRGIDLGGTIAATTGVWGLCVYWVDPLDGRPSQAGVLPINAGTRTIEHNLGYNLGPAPFENWDRERPSVNQVAGNSVGNNDGWLVVYQERSTINAGDDWDLMAVRTNTVGAALGSPLTLVNGGTRHVTSPQVSGVSGYYTLTHTGSADLSSAASASLFGRRVVWLPGQAAFSAVGTASTIATATPPLTTLSNQGLAENHEISTTAVATYTVRLAVGLNVTISAYAARLTGGGAPVDTHTLFSVSDRSAISPAVTFALPGQAYQIVYATNEPSGPIYGRRYTYPADAIEILYGVGCGPMAIGGHRPYIGNPHYQVNGVFGPANVAATLFVGLASAAVPLDIIGMTGCMLNVDPLVLTLGGATDGTGLVVFPFPLPESLLTAYDVFFQIVYVSPGANALNLQATRGLKAQVR